MLLLSSLALAASACDDEAARPRRRPMAPASGSAVAPSSPSSSLELALDAAAPVEPAPAGGDLAADIEAFSTLEACVGARGIADPVLGDALIALGYDGFSRDACRVLQAAKQKRPEPCREIVVSTLRRHCETVLAAVTREAETCPEEALGRGRDASCLAFARRDARLCAGEAEPKKTRCEAILARSTKRCASDRQTRAICEREVARWRTIVGDAPERPPIAPPAASFVIGPADGGAPPSGAADGTSLLASFGQGAVILEEKGTGVRRIDFGSAPDIIPLTSVATSALRMSVELPPSADGGPVALKGGRVRRAEIQLARGPTVIAPPASMSFDVKWKKLELERGGALEFEIDGTAGEGEKSVRARVDVKTFVRDYAPAPPDRAVPKR